MKRTMVTLVVLGALIGGGASFAGTSDVRFEPEGPLPYVADLPVVEAGTGAGSAPAAGARSDDRWVDLVGACLTNTGAFEPDLGDPDRCLRTRHSSADGPASDSSVDDVVREVAPGAIPF